MDEPEENRTHLFMYRELDGLRHVQPVAKRILERWDTRKLLARLEALGSLQECFEWSDWTEEEKLTTRNVIAFKETEIWTIAWNDVKSILATREHVPKISKKEAKKIDKKQQTKNVIDKFTRFATGHNPPLLHTSPNSPTCAAPRCKR